ncbi:MAG: single-stranded-DNA-specific exonuclease RecJ [Elainella sp. Prado103]|jgi:single-stranded-DNA-specific exonuclease|nr:single-stranded-DNA-specific exonuclease RecJ [Elainella sp. Prado103]
MPTFSGLEWQIRPIEQLPPEFLQAVRQVLLESPAAPVLESDGSIGQQAAQLLWQRGVRSIDQLASWLDPQHYQPTSPFAFGEEMEWAVQRLQRAIEAEEKVVIWGDFDADGLTATAVLWDGLRPMFSTSDQLSYFVPNRLRESHGLSIAGINTLAAQGCRLIVTCDTGSTNLSELEYAQQQGIDCIITDHHSLPLSRPPVVAMINPRSLPPDHPFANLSGVAVAYKLVEALYQSLPKLPPLPLTDLLDLVAIGLIADLVNLTGESRYLAQLGIAQLQKNQDPIQPPRPGIAKLLEFCRRNGDRPTDISFGLGPRINAISRIHGDARFCVELLTSQDRDRTTQLARAAELANTRRKALQREVVAQVEAKLAEFDLSTTAVIVLADPQWSVGVLGLVAGQIAQAFNRPTILLSIDIDEVSDANSPVFARGSARSIQQIDLYNLLQQQAHLLSRFGGHPYAAGLSLPVENLPLFTQAINQQMRSSYPDGIPIAPPTADLAVTVADLNQAAGRRLFQALKLLEPCGMGNPVPKLLIRNCWFTKSWHRKIKDLAGLKVEYLKTEFELRDDSCDRGFPGVWWGHYKDELPIDRCDVLVELDFNSYEDGKTRKHYELRLIAVRPQPATISIATSSSLRLYDARPCQLAPAQDATPEPTVTQTWGDATAVLIWRDCPSSWQAFYDRCHQARAQRQALVLAYDQPPILPPDQLWQHWLELVKHLSQTGQTVTLAQLQDRLQVGDRTLIVGLESLRLIGYLVRMEPEQPWADLSSGTRLQFAFSAESRSDSAWIVAKATFAAAVQEQQFLQQYFCQVSIEVLQTAADRIAYSEVADRFATARAAAPIEQ